MRTLRYCYRTSRRRNTKVREELKVAYTVAFRQGQHHQGQLRMQNRKESIYKYRPLFKPSPIRFSAFDSRFFIILSFYVIFTAYLRQTGSAVIILFSHKNKGKKSGYLQKEPSSRPYIE